MKKLLVQDGRLTWIAEIFLGAVVLFGLLGIPFFNVPFWLAIPIGVAALLAAAILMFEGRATALGLKPFTNDPLGWRKAKESYKKGDQKEAKDSKGNES
jgi:hypothetical protein